MKKLNLTNKAFNKLLRLLKDGFAGNLTFPKAGAFALAESAHQELLEELNDNLLNLPSAEQKLFLEDQFLKLEQFGEFMPRDNYDIENSLTKNGLEFLLEVLGGVSPVESFADILESESLEEVRLYRIRNGASRIDPEGFINLAGPDLRAYQQVFAARLLSVTWETLTSRYILREGIEKAVPRKRRWKVRIRVVS